MKIVIFLALVLMGAGVAEAEVPSILSQFLSPVLKPTSNINELKRKCINAAIEGVTLDKQRILNSINNYKGPQPGAVSIEELRGQLEKLEDDLSKYKNMDLNSYQLPEKIDLEGWAGRGNVEKGGQIYFKDQSRSGPFYHVSGINGNNYALIERNATDRISEPKNKYLMTIYLVRQRHYHPFTNYYVYIDSLKKN